MSERSDFTAPSSMLTPTISPGWKPERKRRPASWSCKTQLAKSFQLTEKRQKKSLGRLTPTRKTFFTPLLILRATIQLYRFRKVKDRQRINSRWNSSYSGFDEL